MDGPQTAALTVLREWTRLQLVATQDRDRAIRDALAVGVSYRAVAKAAGLSHSTIRRMTRTRP